MPLIIDREDLRDRPRDTEEAPPRRERRFELPRLMARMGGGFVIAPPKKEEVVKEIEWREGVNQTMERVKSLMDNLALQRGLKEAVAVRQDPMEEAKKTRGDHKRVAGKAAAKAVADVVAEGGVVPPASGEVTQTTVTTTQPRSGPVLPPQTKSKVKP